jgi:hypothetical protein
MLYTSELIGQDLRGIFSTYYFTEATELHGERRLY